MEEENKGWTLNVGYVLFGIFLTLKFVGVDIRWVWVLSPLWVPEAFSFAAAVFTKTLYTVVFVGDWLAYGNSGWSLRK